MNAAIEVEALSKRFGTVVALEDVSLKVEYGRVVGFLGPNGAGKSTLMRALLGLVRSDSGEAHIAGLPYAHLHAPAKTVGAVLDIASAHPRVTARAHLHTYAALGGMDRSRVDTVLSLVGAQSYADRRIGAFSTGMRQRLALATAMLGDPDILVLDEPSNGLDPSGIAWLRTFLREFADAGGAVLLSSHVLHEIEHTIDDVILIDQGRIVWTGALDRLVAQDAPLEEAFLRLSLMNAVYGEVVRLRANGVALWSAVVALACGGGLTFLLALTGPQNAQPPMPDIDTPEGVGFVLGIETVLLFVPALIGTIAITSEYRHRTIGTTFLVAPRRGRVLTAKLAVYTVLGITYGMIASLSALLALIVAAWMRGVPLGVDVADLVPALIQLSLAAAAYMLLGVGIGALTRSPFVAIGVVLGYFLFVEYVLMMIPGVNAIYPFLPGGATASLTSFDFLTGAIARQTALTPATMVSPVVGAAILVAYAVIAAILAIFVPLRRDLR